MVHIFQIGKKVKNRCILLLLTIYTRVQNNRDTDNDDNRVGLKMIRVKMRFIRESIDQSIKQEFKNRQKDQVQTKTGVTSCTYPLSSDFAIQFSKLVL